MGGCILHVLCAHVVFLGNAVRLLVYSKGSSGSANHSSIFVLFLNGARLARLANSLVSGFSKVLWWTMLETRVVSSSWSWRQYCLRNNWM